MLRVRCKGKQLPQRRHWTSRWRWYMPWELGSFSPWNFTMSPSTGWTEWQEWDLCIFLKKKKIVRTRPSSWWYSWMPNLPAEKKDAEPSVSPREACLLTEGWSIRLGYFEGFIWSSLPALAHSPGRCLPWLWCLYSVIIWVLTEYTAPEHGIKTPSIHAKGHILYKQVGAVGLESQTSLMSH